MRGNFAAMGRQRAGCPLLRRGAPPRQPVPPPAVPPPAVPPRRSAQERTLPVNATAPPSASTAIGFASIKALHRPLRSGCRRIARNQAGERDRTFLYRARDVPGVDIRIVSQLIADVVSNVAVGFHIPF